MVPQKRVDGFPVSPIYTNLLNLKKIWGIDAAIEAGLSGWKCTQGGSSDTRIWAEHGIQSVNPSAGYNYEHTDDEYLDVQACYGTVQLIQSG